MGNHKKKDSTIKHLKKCVNTIFIKYIFLVMIISFLNSLSLILNLLFIFKSLNGITQFTFAEAEIQKSNITTE